MRFLRNETPWRARQELCHNQSCMNPEKVQDGFFVGQIVLGVIFIAIAWVFVRPGRRDSGFRDSKQDVPGVNPASLNNPARKNRRGGDDLGSAKIRTNPTMRLAGLSIEGKPHEILGVPPDADEVMVQRAFKDLILRFHPDRVGRPGSREWKDAQSLAEAITRARVEMLAQIRSRSS